MKGCFRRTTVSQTRNCKNTTKLQKKHKKRSACFLFWFTLLPEHRPAVVSTQLVIWFWCDLLLFWCAVIVTSLSWHQLHVAMSPKCYTGVTGGNRQVYLLLLFFVIKLKLIFFLFKSTEKSFASLQCRSEESFSLQPCSDTFSLPLLSWF